MSPSVRKYGVGAPRNRVLIEEQVASADSSLEFLTGIDSMYDIYELEGRDVVTVDDNVTLNLRISDDGGSTFKSTSYSNVSLGGGSEFADTTNMILLSEAATTRRSFFIARLFNFVSGAALPHIRIQDNHYNSPTQFDTNTHAAEYESTITIDGIEIKFSTGNIASGVFTLFGIAD